MSAAPGAIPPSQAERALAEALVRGEESAFEQLVREHAPRLLGLCRRILGGSQAEAEDCLQEVFLRVLERMSQFEGRSKLGTWLHRVAVNTALMRLRSSNRRSEDSIDELLPSFDDRGHWAGPQQRELPHSPETLLERSDIRDRVHAAIQQLPESHRVVLLLRDIEEMNTAETAEVLEVSEGVVKTRLHRARAALKRLLEMDLYPDEKGSR
ncbi:MAG: sigma-70 family RNA polymerase sigma factor [Acidobacteriota bacterium]